MHKLQVWQQMKDFIKFTLAAIAFIIVYGLIEMFAVWSAPVLGPIILIGTVVGLFTLMVKIAKGI